MKTILNENEQKEYEDLLNFIETEENEGRLDTSFAKIREEIRNYKDTDK